MLRCDACGIDFEWPYGCRRNQQYHACSRKCHGLLERKGAPHDIKKRVTSVAHYGVEHPRKSAIVEEQRKNTCLERYGVEYSLQSSDVRERGKQTLMKMYGVENAFQSEIVKQKIKQTLKERYGVEHPLQSKQICDSVDWLAVWRNQHATKKSKGSYAKSHSEDLFYNFLVLHFGDTDVERQKVVNEKWAIDFYIKSIDTYVQFDGVYWHGLNRSIEAIAEHRTPRDVAIERMWHIDQLQNMWFIENHLRLVRVTDKLFKRNPMAALQMLIDT